MDFSVMRGLERERGIWNETTMKWYPMSIRGQIVRIKKGKIIFIPVDLDERTCFEYRFEFYKTQYFLHFCRPMD